MCVFLTELVCVLSLPKMSVVWSCKCGVCEASLCVCGVCGVYVWRVVWMCGVCGGVRGVLVTFGLWVAKGDSRSAEPKLGPVRHSHTYTKTHKTHKRTNAHHTHFRHHSLFLKFTFFSSSSFFLLLLFVSCRCSGAVDGASDDGTLKTWEFGDPRCATHRELFVLCA